MQTEGQQDGRDGYEDAKISRDRALKAMVEAEDFPTKRSLWRLALCMNGKMKAAGIDGDCADPRLTCAGTPVGARTR